MSLHRKYYRIPQEKNGEFLLYGRGRPVGLAVSEYVFADQRIYYGFSLCSETDCFSYKAANAKALERLASRQFFVDVTEDNKVCLEGPFHKVLPVPFGELADEVQWVIFDALRQLRNGL